MDTFKKKWFVILVIVLSGLIWIACTGDDDDDEWNPPPATEDWERDILDTALTVDIAGLEGTATVQLAGASTTGASFEVGGLEILSVQTAEGPLNYEIVDDQMNVGVPAGSSAVDIDIAYRFAVQDNFDGYMESGVTLIWPYFCGNLFPCHSEPYDGLTFELSLSGFAAGLDAVYPQQIASNAPSYQIAWAIGDYTSVSLGNTDAGTEVVVWTFTGSDALLSDGTQDLVAVMDWYEKTLGAYPFGNRTGAVEVSWGGGAYGGMEHHPYWHVSSGAFGEERVHHHEAGHGWFGGGIRIRCWEDFVLSEGTVTYLTARVTEEVLGEEAAQSIWNYYENRLNWLVDHNDGIAWPDSCGEVDILEDGLFSGVPYYKGAFFYKAVADEIGKDTLDQVFASFCSQYVGQAALMQDMIDHILAETGFDPTDLAEGWLRSLGRPD